MHKFVRSLITEWRRLELPVENATVVVAVSGGTDSNSLLLALDDLKQRRKIGVRIVAADFNHRLRGPEADGDEDFIRQLTTKLKIEFAVGHTKPDKMGNLEQNACEARYRFLGDTAKRLGAIAVLTAHTMNDQAETFLMNLIRGSGPDGLRGMTPVRSSTQTLGDTVTRGTKKACLSVPMSRCLRVFRSQTRFFSFARCSHGQNGAAQKAIATISASNAVTIR